MRKILSFIILLGMNFPIFSQNTHRVEADVQHVTVFLNRAQIDAKIKTNIPAGTSKLFISNVATTTDPNSIQVGGKGDVVLMGVKFKQNFLGNKKRNVLEDSLKISKTELEAVEMVLKVSDNERTMLMANANIKNEKDGITPEDLKEMMDFFRTKLTEIGTRQLQLTKQANELKERINRLNNQLNSQGSNISGPTGEIELTVQAKNQTTLDLNLSYIANGAGWSPIYDIRAKDVKSDIQLGYKANVFQQTGIDWKNVKLTLSTANPAEGGTKPELYANFVSIYEPVVIQAKNARAGRSEGIMAVEAAPMAAAADASSTAAFVNTVESTLSVNFDISIPYTINSGSNSELVDIQNHLLSASYDYYAVPKLDKDAFLTAKVTDWEKYNLLPGTANIYFEGTFVGTSDIAGGNTKDSLMISLGRDKKIVTKREEISDFKSRKNVGSSVRETFGYKITVRNTKSDAVTILLEDQVPISQDSRIEVELEEAKGADFNRENGKLTWKLTLNPQENKEIYLKYNVKYPKGKVVSGI